MNKRFFSFIVAVCAMLGAARLAQAQDFKLAIPTIPFPPLIEEYSAGAAAADTPVTIKAVITPQSQKTVICPTSDNPFDCETEELQLADESPDRLPENPPPIVSAKVYYYANGDNAAEASVSMSYNESTGKWEGQIPGFSVGTEVTYYIVAADSVGNVASMARYLGGGASFPNWDVTGATPDFDNCSTADYHLVCSKVETEALNCKTSGCNATDGAKYCYTVKDPYGADGSSFDTCGAPDDDGNQTLQAGLGKTDMKGLSAWSDGSWLNLKLGLVGPIPTAADSPPIEAYIFLILNPDIPDSTPNDMAFSNGFAITYAPEAQGTDPTLVKVLWEADCLFTSGDPLGCKLITGTSGNDLKIGQDPDDGALRVEVKHTGSAYKGAKSDGLIGNTTNNVIVVALAGNIDIVGASGAMNDQLPGLSYYAEQGTYTVTTTPAPSPVDIITQTCDGQNKVCAKSDSQPSKNTCAVKFNMVESFTNHYEVFRSTVSTSQGDQIGSDIAHVAEGTAYTFSDDITTLDGTTYYYQFVSVGAPDPPDDPDGKRSSASKAQCTVEDWVAPTISNAVKNTSCDTPDGFKGVVKLVWNSDTVTDPSLSGFYVQREGERLNFTKPVGAISNDTTFEYSYTDKGEDLEDGRLPVGSPINYTITVFDRGDNNATTSNISCTPLDRQPPGDVETLLFSMKPGVLGVDLSWEELDRTEDRNDDVMGYNVYRCREEQKNETCRNEEDGSGLPLWEKLAGPISGSLVHPDTDFQPEDENQRFCYWIRPIDDSDNEPKLPGDAVNWDTVTACFPVTKEGETLKPSAAADFEVVDTKKGHTVQIKWRGPTTNVDSTSFSDVTKPEALELTGFLLFENNENPVPTDKNDLVKRVTDLSQYGSLAGEKQFKYEIDLIYGKDGKPYKNGESVCFTLLTVDVFNNSSSSGQKCVVPTDTVAPSAPTLAEMECDDAECVMTWESPDDWDALTFDVYRCTGSSDSCASAASFSKINESEIFEEVTKIQTYVDDSGDPQQPYTYLIVANDPAGNASGVAAALAAGRGKVGGIGLGPNCPTTVQVSGTEIDGESDLPTNAALCWNASSSSTVAGYNIYSCPSANGLVGCTKMNSSLKTSAPGKNCTSPVSTDVVEDPGSTLYYTVVAVDGDGIECLADTAAWDGPIEFHGSSCEGGIALSGHIDISLPTYVDPGALLSAFPSSAGLKLKVCLAGYNVSMEGSDPDLTGFDFDLCLLPCVKDGDCASTGVSDSTCGTGSDLEIFVGGLSALEYLGNKSGLKRIASVASGDLSVLEVDAEEPKELTVSQKLLKAANAGDANGDGKVTIQDFGKLRAEYGNKLNPTCSDSNNACDGADFNRDGKVTIQDFGVMRSHYGYGN